MPAHFFLDAIEIDYSTAIQANISKQDYTVVPRYWYVDTYFRCSDCACDYVWSALEQKEWFETYEFYVDARPGQCRGCRAKRRDAIQLRKEYDALVGSARDGGTAEQKRQIVELIDELEGYLNVVPERMRETRARLQRQLSAEDTCQ